MARRHRAAPTALLLLLLLLGWGRSATRVRGQQPASRVTMCGSVRLAVS
eukprot:gene50405-37739_t